MLDFRRRVVRIATGAALIVCASSVLLGYWAVALGVGLGSLASIAGFLLAAKKSLRLFSIRESRSAAAFSFKWFLPRFFLYGLALLVGTQYSRVDFASVVVGIFLCNVILVLYEPLLSRFFASQKRGSGAFTGEV